MANAPPSTTSPVRLLIVDDDEQLRHTLERRFRRQGMEVVAVGSAEEALPLLEERRFDVALLDLHLPGASGVELLVRLKAIQPEAEALLLTGHASVDTAIQAMKAGAYDYLTKPFHLPELELHIQRAYEKGQLLRRQWQWAEHLRYESPRYRLVGSSPAMQRVHQLIEKVAGTATTVLICGPSGTGKELVARAIHHNSARSDRPLVTINCAALQETLLESELFGHEKGSFTGAVAAKPGLFEVAEGGTLFIDEVAEMAPGLQAKLLRVLEDGRFRRVGGTHEIRANVRVVAATNKALEEEQRAGRFREDLYYRLNVFSITLPPLKERPGDVAELIEHFLTTRQVGPVRFRVHPEALAALLRYDWPGNVRELVNVLERAQILAEEHLITLDDLPEAIVDHDEPTASGPGDPLHLREVERRHIEMVLRQEHGNKVQAARVLGISRRALYRLIEKHHLSESMNDER